MLEKLTKITKLTVSVAFSPGHCGRAFKRFCPKELGRLKILDSPSFPRALTQGSVYKYLLTPDGREEPFMLYPSLTSDIVKLCRKGLLHFPFRPLYRPWSSRGS